MINDNPCSTCGRWCNCPRMWVDEAVRFRYSSYAFVLSLKEDGVPFEPPYMGEPEHVVWAPPRGHAPERPPRKLADYPHYRRHARRESRRPIELEDAA